MGRVDAEGTARKIHIDQSVRATKKFKEDSKKKSLVRTNATSNIVESDFFTTNIFETEEILRKDYSNIDPFVILICLNGCASVTADASREIVYKDETILLLADISNASFFSKDAQFLEVYISLLDHN
ncbi:MAG: mannose-6-phosphate isomerase [Dokdonia sp.]